MTIVDNNAKRTTKAKAVQSFIKILTVILLGEILVMLFINVLPIARTWDIILDPFLLAILTAPLLYLIIVRPLKGALEQREQALERLNEAHRQLQAQEQQLKAANQQLEAHERQLSDANRQLEISMERAHQLAQGRCPDRSWRFVGYSFRKNIIVHLARFYEKSGRSSHRLFQPPTMDGTTSGEETRGKSSSL